MSSFQVIYIVAEENVIEAVLTLETEAKDHVGTYAGRRFLDAETRYIFIENECLSLRCACTELRHYLFNTFIVACQTDIIKYMLHKPILKCRIGKWACILIGYDLVCKHLKSMKRQVIADFIVQQYR